MATTIGLIAKFIQKFGKSLTIFHSDLLFFFNDNLIICGYKFTKLSALVFGIFFCYWRNDECDFMITSIFSAINSTGIENRKSTSKQNEKKPKNLFQNVDCNDSHE